MIERKKNNNHLKPSTNEMKTLIFFSQLNVQKLVYSMHAECYVLLRYKKFV